MRIAIVGSGLSGTVIANELVKLGFSIDLFESRDHIGGNCYTSICSETGIVEHKYGPHIFHTDNERAWDYVNSYMEMMPYVNRVKTNYNGEVYSLPINLHTINQFFKKNFNPKEAELFIERISTKKTDEIISFEDQALRFVGPEIYEAFFKNYTKKQWGIDPRDLPASILKRLPLRFDYNDNYFNHRFQGIPRNGYTEFFEKILLNNKKINVMLNTNFSREMKSDYDYVITSSPLDVWFNKSKGKLAYRTLDFSKEIHHGSYQGCAVMNYPSENYKFTRITEHKYFSPWVTNTDKTIIYKEYSRDCEDSDIPYYPIRLLGEMSILKEYIELAKKEDNVLFVGRLGTYRYMDMDVTIMEALDTVDAIKKNLEEKKILTGFFRNPL